MAIGECAAVAKKRVQPISVACTIRTPQIKNLAIENRLVDFPADPACNVSLEAFEVEDQKHWTFHYSLFSGRNNPSLTGTAVVFSMTIVHSSAGKCGIKCSIQVVYFRTVNGQFNVQELGVYRIGLVIVLACYNTLELASK